MPSSSRIFCLAMSLVHGMELLLLLQLMGSILSPFKWQHVTIAVLISFVHWPTMAKLVSTSWMKIRVIPIVIVTMATIILSRLNAQWKLVTPWRLLMNMHLPVYMISMNINVVQINRIIAVHISLVDWLNDLNNCFNLVWKDFSLSLTICQR